MGATCQGDHGALHMELLGQVCRERSDGEEMPDAGSGHLQAQTRKPDH